MPSHSMNSGHIFTLRVFQTLHRKGHVILNHSTLFIELEVSYVALVSAHFFSLIASREVLGGGGCLRALKFLRL